MQASSNNYQARRAARNGGFTLTEIMIVVSLIGLLSAMALPHLAKARDNTRLNIIYRNLRQLDNAKDQWAIDNRKVTGDVVADITDLKDYLRGGKLHDVINEDYVVNPVGTPPGAALPNGVALGPYPAGGYIPAP